MWTARISVQMFSTIITGFKTHLLNCKGLYLKLCFLLRLLVQTEVSIDFKSFIKAIANVFLFFLIIILEMSNSPAVYIFTCL